MTNPIRWSWVLVLLWVCCGPGALLATAQTSTPTATATPVQNEIEVESNRLDQRRRELLEQIASAEQLPKDPTGVERLRLLRLLLATVEGELSEIKAFEAAREAYVVPILSSEPPYALEEVDDVRVRRQRANQRLKTLASLRTTRNQELRAAEGVLRHLPHVDQAGLGLSPSALQYSLAEEQVRREKLMLSLAVQERALAEDAVQALDALLNRVSGQVYFSRSELEAKKREIARRREHLKQRLHLIRQRLLAEDQAGLDVPPADTSRRGLAQGVSSEQARAADLQVQRSLEEQLEALEAQSRLWDLRFKVYQGTPPPEAHAETRLIQERLQRQTELLESSLAELRAGQADARREAALEEERALLLETSDLAQRVLDDQKQLGGVAFSWRVGWRRAWSAWGRVWNFELLEVGDQAITVRKVVLALVILVLGLNLSRRAIVQLHRKALVPMGVPVQRAVILEKVTYYVLVLLVGLLALRMVNIPLTFFTFLGGSVAIAVGFGAQTLFNNFIGGLILTFEQPIRVGDLIDIEGTYGIVRDIGARTTHVETSAGVHILVPNSKLLENNLINWTLGDATVRTSVKVTVAYGTDAHEVSRLIHQVMEAHPMIHKDRSLTVLFSDFGKDGLEFEALFWLTVKRMMDRRTLESDLRFAIYELFRDKGIEIPYRQRDLHLRSAVPLRIEDNREK
jgi:potassium-dependent mechanosensitive channel